jgi:hypothetical protein
MTSYATSSPVRPTFEQYGCLAFLGDVIMTLLTGGLWLIWIFVRE